MLRMISSLWARTEGSALVEATVLAPVLFVLVFGVFDFSWYFYNQQLVEIGVRDAARYLAVASSNPCSDSSLLTNAKNLATTGSIGGSAPKRVNGWNPADVIIPCPSGFDVPNPSLTYNGGSTIYIVYVTTTFADPTLGFFTLLNNMGVNVGVPNISASHKERAIGE